MFLYEIMDVLYEREIMDVLHEITDVLLRIFGVFFLFCRILMSHGRCLRGIRQSQSTLTCKGCLRWVCGC